MLTNVDIRLSMLSLGLKVDVLKPLPNQMLITKIGPRQALEARATIFLQGA